LVQGNAAATEWNEGKQSLWPGMNGQAQQVPVHQVMTTTIAANRGRAQVVQVLAQRPNLHQPIVAAVPVLVQPQVNRVLATAGTIANGQPQQHLTPAQQAAQQAELERRAAAAARRTAGAPTPIVRQPSPPVAAVAASTPAPLINNHQQINNTDIVIAPRTSVSSVLSSSLSSSSSSSRSPMSMSAPQSLSNISATTTSSDTKDRTSSISSEFKNELERRTLMEEQDREYAEAEAIDMANKKLQKSAEEQQARLIVDVNQHVTHPFPHKCM
jgi:hypothetical protein